MRKKNKNAVSKKVKHVMIGLFLIFAIITTVALIINIHHRETISADAWLAFISNVIGWTIAIFTLYITIMQATKTFEKESNRLRKARLSEICPRIFISVQKGGNDTFVISFQNVGTYVAVEILVFETKVMQFLEPNEKKTVVVSFSTNLHMDGVFCIDPILVDFTSTGYPKEIILTFGDIENNTIQQVFKCYVNSAHAYDPHLVDYV